MGRPLPVLSGAGSVCEIRQPQRATCRRGGGVRGPVRLWSSASRRRLLKTVAAIDFDQLSESWGGSWFFATLTYKEDPGQSRCKRDLDVLARRWTREFGVCRWVWKMEFQRRGVPHFHIIAWVPHTHTLGQVRKWLWAAWEETAQQGESLRVDLESVRSKSPASYFVSYARSDKEIQHRLPELWSGGGRWWGVRGMSPQWSRRQLSPREFVAARRVLVRYRRSRSRKKFRSPKGLNGCWVLGGNGGSLYLDLCRFLA